MKAMNRSQIEQWLITHNITNYTIDETLSVDVNGDVDISNSTLTALPVQFGNVTGHFDCYINKLTTLQHCPISVGGDFICSDNQLISLQCCPTIVSGTLSCGKNQLTSLQYCPISVGGYFYCSNNPFIVTRENEGSWIRAITINKDIYKKIPTHMVTQEMTQMQRFMWEL